VSAYVIVQLDVEDPALFEQYKAQVPAVVAAHGGRYLARGGRYEVLCGDWPVERTVLLEFPTMVQARAWHESADYAGPRAIRDKAARVTAVVIEGLTHTEWPDEEE